MKKLISGGTLGRNKTMRKASKVPMGPKKGSLGASGPIPSGDKLDKLYKQALEELAIPESKRGEMIEKESPEKKWMLIQAHSQMLKQTGGKGSGDNSKHSASYWVDLISQRKADNTPVITVEEAGEFYAVVRTAHKQFLVDFIENDGVEMLIDLTRWYTTRDPTRRLMPEKKILPQLMSCYKALMNNSMGMESVLGVTDSITNLAMGLDLTDESNLQTSQEIIMLLAVTCFYSPEGRDLVVQSMDDLRQRWRESHKYQTLVDTFSNCDDSEFRAAVSMFITTIVNSASEVESRVQVRNDFLALDIMTAFQRVLREAKEENSESYAVIATQYQVFEDMMAEDHKEVMYSIISGTTAEDVDLDLSEAEGVFTYLQQSTASSGFPDLLLELLQSLLLVPAERSLGIPTWEAINQFIREATDVSRHTNGKIRLNYQLLGDLLDKRAELDERLGQVASGDDIIGSQRKRIKALEGEVKNLRKNGGAKNSGGSGSSGGDASSEEVEILQTEIKNLQTEISNLQKQVKTKGKISEEDLQDDSTAQPVLGKYKGKLDSTGLQPAGPIPGAKNPTIPACPLPNMPGSLELAPNPCKSGAKSSSKAKKSDKGRGGAAPNLGGALAAIASRGATDSGKSSSSKTPSVVVAPQKKESEADIVKRLGLPPKKSVKPSCKMRNMFWTPIPVDKIDGTIWPELSDQKIKFGSKNLESRFGLEADQNAGRSKNSQGNQRKSLGLIHLVTGNRQQNVGIALSKVRASDDEIVEAIWSMDETMLTSEHTQVLMKACPTEDEVGLIKNFEASNGDPKKLAREDRFMRKVSKIPNLHARLTSALTWHNFDDDVERIDFKAQIVREACVEVERSPKLKKLLEIVLALGNYLNGGTPRGGAWGFKLEALGKLDTIKDNTSKGTLMDYLYDMLERNYPDLLDFEMPSCRDAMDVNLAETQSELNQLAARVRTIKSTLNEDAAHKKDKFKKKMSGFEVKASKRVATLQGDFEKARAAFQKVASMFAETGAGVEPETFFAKFVRFEIALKRAARLVEERREREEQARRAAAEKQRRITLKKLRELEAAGADEGVFAKFAKANAGNAEDIVQRFLERNRNKISTARPAAKSKVNKSKRSSGSKSKSKSKSKSSSSSKEKVKVKIVRVVQPDGTVVEKRVRKKKKKKPTSTVPNAQDFDLV